MKKTNKALQICSALLLVLGTPCFSQQAKLDVSGEQKLLMTVRATIESNHYNPAVFDDTFSMQLWDNYIKELDPLKQLFLQSDLDGLRRYRTLLDDELKGKRSLEFFPAVLSVYKQRLEEAKEEYKVLLSSSFSFKEQEYVNVDGSSLEDFAPNKSALSVSRKKRVKYLVLQKFVSLRQLDSTVVATVQEAEARQKVGLRLERTMVTLIGNAVSDRQLPGYINNIAHLMDPHTNYLSSAQAKSFLSKMGNRNAGIGAALGQDEDGARILYIEDSGAAVKGGLEVNDLIVRVGEGANGELKDLGGYTLPEIIEMIKGEAGTTLRVEVKKAGGKLQTVSMVRGMLDQTNNAVKTAIVEKAGKKIGYISFPLFYQDINPMGSQVSTDVAIALEGLKRLRVDAIVFDLRHNGGGSLQEVVKMVSLLIKDGPVVQVRERDGIPMTRSRYDMVATFSTPGSPPYVEQIYDGPLAVLVDEYSASASEIFTSAIQDYKRGVIIGSTTTYGKGTVQKPIPLGAEENGSINLTIAQYYRVSGGSTQNKGIIPDVVLPDLYEYIKFRERELPGSLSWDMVAGLDYQPWSGKMNIPKLQELANKRLSNDPVFKQIAKNALAVQKTLEEKVSLKLDTYRNNLREEEKLSEENKRILMLPAGSGLKAVSKLSNNQWINSIDRDIYIDQALQVVLDMLKTN